MEEGTKKGWTFWGGMLELAKKDSIYILLVIFALGASAYTMLHVDSYIDQCNLAWQSQFEALHILGSPYNRSEGIPTFNESIKYDSMIVPSNYNEDNEMIIEGEA
jgi:hypothetical protein